MNQVGAQLVFKKKHVYILGIFMTNRIACVHVCVRTCVRACVCACVRAYVRVAHVIVFVFIKYNNIRVQNLFWSIVDVNV